MDIKRERSGSKSQIDDEEDEEKTVRGGGGGTKLKVKGNTLRMKDLGEGEVEGGDLEGKWRKKW